jgi:hypothetical protein
MLAGYHTMTTPTSLAAPGGAGGHHRPGAFADLLVVGGHPIEDLGLLAKPDATLCLVTKAGEIIVDGLEAWLPSTQHRCVESNASPAGLTGGEPDRSAQRALLNWRAGERARLFPSRPRGATLRASLQ